MGFASIKKLQREIDAHEYAEWRAYYKVERFGDDWEQTGKICETVANIVSRKTWTASDFMPKGSVVVKKKLSKAEADAVARKMKKAMGFS